MLLRVLLLCVLFLSAAGQQMDDDWLDPYDMLNYDPSTKSMRKPSEQTTFTNVNTKRREYVQDPNQADLMACSQQVQDLQNQIEVQKKRLVSEPTCNPVFKRFLSRVLMEIQRVGVPSDSTDVFYDAKVKLSKQAVTEIQSLLEGEDRWRTGALDSALSQILMDFKPHNYEAWKWRFEDTFGVELDTMLKIGIFILIISTIICTQLWSMVSWFIQFKRMFCVCFVVSVVWNWLYLYQTAFAQHQKKIVKMENFDQKCTGVKKMDWSDSLKEWYRTTWTLQDDPCEEYYKVLLINPLLLVPPTKAISVTITTFITDPLQHIGQGISEFLRALLKDLPVTLQIPVLLIITLSILVVFYGSVQAAFQHGIMAPLRRPRRDPPHPELEQTQRLPLRIMDHDPGAGGDAPAPSPAPALAPASAPASAPAPAPAPAPALARHDATRRTANNVRSDRNNVRQRHRVRHEPAPISIETLRRADRHYSEDETDARACEGSPDSEDNHSAESDSENQHKTQDDVEAEDAVTTAAAHTTRPKNKQTNKKPPQKKENQSEDEPHGDGAAARRPSAERQPAQTGVQDPEEESSAAMRSIETIGVPVQETKPAVMN